MENLSFGFLLMLVGMVTVFVILLIVIFGSKLLIKLINRIAPEQARAAVPAAASVGPDATTEAILKEAVARITGGKGHITKITRL